MSPADFAQFLKRLSPDADEAERIYLSLQKKLIGFFSMKGVSDPACDAAETLDRAADRINRGVNVPDVASYCLGIARNVARESWRRARREDTVFRRFIDGLADGSDEEVERIQHVLKPCFESLEAESRGLLVAYCQIPEGLSHAEHRRRLAESMGITVRALRIQVSRLRDRLEDCVGARSENR